MADRHTKHRMIAQLETGCPPGEIRHPQWSEVRGNALVILAAKAKDREERHMRITATLRAVLDERQNGPDGEPLAPSAYAFGNAAGELVSKEKAGELWWATCIFRSRAARKALIVNIVGAGGRGRTVTTLRSRDFESRASASFTTPAQEGRAHLL